MDSSSSLDKSSSDLVITSRPSKTETKPTRTRNTRGGQRRTRNQPSKIEEPKTEPQTLESPRSASKIKEVNGKKKQSVDLEFSEDSGKDQIRGEVEFSQPVVADPGPNPPKAEEKKEEQENINVDTSKDDYSNQLVTGSYFISREKRVSHLKSKQKYIIKSNTSDLLIAKDIGFLTPDVYINEGSEIHVKAQNFKYKMTTNFKQDEFKILKGTEEIGSLMYNNEYGDSYGPRKIQVKFGETEIHSKIPRLAKDGHWVLQFGGHFTLSSMRNAILLDSEGKSIITIRKVGKNVLELTVTKPVPLYIIACLGISSYIYSN